jgi:hypothetical protein
MNGFMTQLTPRHFADGIKTCVTAPFCGCSPAFSIDERCLMLFFPQKSTHLKSSVEKPT